MSYRDEEGQLVDTTGFEPAHYIPAERPRFGDAGARGVSLPGDDAGVGHQPHLGYALGALGIGLLCLLVCTVAVLLAAYRLHLVASLRHLDPAQLPKTSIAGEALGYGLAVLIVVPLFRRMWNRPFGRVLRLNFAAARANVGKLLLIGVGVSVLAQAAESLLTLPKEVPLDAFFRTPSDVWVVAIFGTLIAPPIEELLFRGFLLPAFAIAYDWLRLPRTDEARVLWHSAAPLSRSALIFAAIATSLLFGAMHAAQLGFAWNAVGLLSCVGGVLAFVRLRFNSLAASSLVHMMYNGLIFVIIFVLTDGFRHLDKMHGH